MKKKAKKLSVFLYLLSCAFSFLLYGKNEKPGPLNGIQGVNKPILVDNNNSMRELHRKSLFPGARQVDLLRALLEMPPEKLRIMRKAIERVEGMSSVQKKEIKIRLRKLKDLKPDHQAHELRVLHRRHDILNKYWQSLNSESRQAEMKKFYSLSLSERSIYWNKIKELK